MSGGASCSGAQSGVHLGAGLAAHGGEVNVPGSACPRGVPPALSIPGGCGTVMSHSPSGGHTHLAPPLREMAGCRGRSISSGG